MTDPVEILSVGTFSVEAPAEYDPACDNQLPRAVVDGMGPADAFVWVLRRDGPSTSGPPRPAHFDPLSGDAWPCPRSLPAGTRARWIWFNDNGHDYYAGVLVGPQATRIREAEAFAILDSLDLSTSEGPAKSVPPQANQPGGRDPGPGVFSQQTAAVLLFSDGLDGVLAVDLDNRIAGRRAVEGERAGDQQFRLTRVGDSLVVGWGEIYAAPLIGGASTLVDTAVVYVPAAEPDEVWTLDYPGGRAGGGTPVVRRVDTSGNTVFTSPGFDGDRYRPLIGVPGGLAVSTPNGIAVWDAASGNITQESPGRPYQASSNGRQLAWCSDPCHSVRLFDLATVGAPTPQHTGPGTSLVFSPDGEQIAYLDRRDNGSALIVERIDTGDKATVASRLDDFAYLNWGPRGDQLFYATYSYKKPAMTLGRYDARTRRWEQHRIRVGDGLGFVVLNPGEATTFLPTQLGEPSNCPPPSVFPSGRSGICGFEF